MENHAHIINKERKDQLLTFNQAQDDIYNVIKRRRAEGKPCYILVLKARQLGMSTFTEGLGTTMCVMYPNQSMFIMTHEEKASQQLYGMAHYYYENFPEWLKAEAEVIKDNQSLMSFTNGSKIQTMVASPNSSGTGRGQTFTFAHLSEFDWWNGDAMSILAGVLSACTKDAIVIIETTANGCGNFKKMWDEAVKQKLDGEDDGWIPLFYPWHTDTNYRMPYSGFELTPEEERLKKKFNLDLEQIAWRRNMIKTRFSGDVTLFNQEFPATPEEAFISSGKCIFDLNKIAERKEQLRELTNPFIDKGYFLYDLSFDSFTHERKLRDIRWVSDYKNGYITIYKKVENRHPYTLAVDPAGDGSDFTAGVCLDNRSASQVCVLHANGMQSFEIACQAYCLGIHYNEALLGAETNFAPEIMTYLKELGYPNLYIQGNDTNDVASKFGTKYGFRTTTVTRPHLISMLIEYINKSNYLVNDYQTLVEAENFVRVYKLVDGKTKQKEQANAGQHDDLLMSLGICLYMRDSSQASFELLPEKIEEDSGEITMYDIIFGRKKAYKEDEGVYMTYD